MTDKAVTVTFRTSSISTRVSCTDIDRPLDSAQIREFCMAFPRLKAKIADMQPCTVRCVNFDYVLKVLSGKF